MEVALPLRQHLTWSRALTVSGAVVMAILTSYFTYLFTASLNIETAVQQQQMAAVQQFEASGAHLDTSLSLFADALLDNKDVDEARKEVRTAITLHAENANALRPIVGDGNVNQYLRGLHQLRKLADRADNPPTTIKAAQEHVYLMDYRLKLAALARRNIYS